MNKALERQPLTDLLLRKLKGSEERIGVWDAKLPGFGIRVAPSGTKSFVLLYRFRGQPRRLTLGQYPVLGLAEAREIAKEALNLVARGSIRDRVKRSVQRVTPLKMSSKSSCVCVATNDVLDVLRSIVERGSPVGANNALSAIRKCFNWCFERGLVEISPCSGVTKASKPKARDRVLSDDELTAICNAANEIGYPFGACAAVDAHGATAQ